MHNYTITFYIKNNYFQNVVRRVLLIYYIFENLMFDLMEDRWIFLSSEFNLWWFVQINLLLKKMRERM